MVNIQKYMDLYQQKQIIDGAKQFPNALNEGQSDVLKIKEGSLPMLLVIENNEVKEHKTGENEILSYLKDVIKDAIAKK